MSGSFDKRGDLDISDGRLIFCTGKKKSGKSILARVFFDSYPGDKIVIDVAGDDGPNGPDILTIRGDVSTLPRRWPEGKREEGKYMTLRYAPDAGSATFLEDMDAVVGLALSHGRSERDKGRLGCCLLIHEVGVVAPVHQTQAHMRRALMHNRHNGLTVIMCGPRPINVDPLVLQQSDLVYVFELMNPNDRKRLAESVGWDPRDFDDAVSELGRHEYLRFDANEMKPANEHDPDMRILHFPPLPEDVVKSLR